MVENRLKMKLESKKSVVKKIKLIRKKDNKKMT